MAAPLEYPHAGVRISLPAAFELLPVGVRGQILSAARPADGLASMRITLDTRMVGKGVTPGGFWDFATGYWQRGGAADVRLIEERDVPARHGNGDVGRRPAGGLDERARLGRRDVLLAGTEIDQQLAQTDDVRHM